jgi:agmatine deiminase
VGAALVSCSGAARVEPDDGVQPRPEPRRPVGAAPVSSRPSALLPKWRTPHRLSRTAPDQLRQGLTPNEYRRQNISLFRITQAPPVKVRSVAQFEPAQVLLLAWLNQQDSSLDDVYVAIIRGVLGKVKILVTTERGNTGALKSILSRYGVLRSALDDATQIEFDEHPVDSIWTRDYGPDFIADEKGNVAMADVRYYPERVLDDAYPAHLSAKLGIASFRPSLSFEGGSLTTNGKGVCLVTHWVFAENAPEPESQVRSLLKDYVGCEKVIPIRRVLREGTGHTDMEAKFISEDTVLLGENQAVLRGNYGTLMNSTTVDGKPLRVIRIPMPGNKDGSFRTYANSLMVNKVVLVPVYQDDTKYEAEALAVYKRALPDYTIVPIDSTNLIPQGGAIHCITKTVPKGAFLPPSGEAAAKCGDTFACPSVNGCGDVPSGGKCFENYAVFCDRRGAGAEACDIDCSQTQGQEPCASECAMSGGQVTCGKKLSCRSTCKDECVPGPATCADEKTAVTCGPVEFDGCRRKQTVFCAEEEDCTDGACVPRPKPEPPKPADPVVSTVGLPGGGDTGGGSGTSRFGCGVSGGAALWAIPLVLALVRRRRSWSAAA